MRAFLFQIPHSATICGIVKFFQHSHMLHAVLAVIAAIVVVFIDFLLQCHKCLFVCVNVASYDRVQPALLTLGSCARIFK